MYLKCSLILLLFTKISAVTILDKIEWTVHNANGSINIPARVPGGIYSDLREAGIIEDILYRFTDVQSRWVARDSWTYEGQFTVGKEELNYEVVNLVLHGVDTVAFVELNGSPVGATDNMFVRYVFDVKNHLKEGENSIKIVFESPIKAAELRSKAHFTAPNCVPDLYNGECHVNQLRKMQASFAWDWGPAFPSVGLWKPVALEFYNGAIIRSVTTYTEKSGQHWYLVVKSFLEVNKNIKTWEGLYKAKLGVEGPQNISFAKGVEATVNDGFAEIELNLTISENVVRAWWPNGYGEQQLYNLLITVVSRGEAVSKSMAIGFRTLELIEEDASIKLGNSTAGQGLTFYFKVNGYPIFMKGSNWIPAHILPELGYDNATVNGILEAAKDSHMNMLRVWGGGVYESDLFYERCDQLGILIWQDLMFACSMYPTDVDFIKSVKQEIEQNVKRIQYHPSIAVWAGNNENEVALRGNWYDTQAQFNKYKNEYIKLYVDTIKPIVNELDPGRRYLVSSPSNGKKSEEDGYVAVNPYDSHYGDTHYYNYLSDMWNMDIYPTTRFASEYGFQSLPTLLTMTSATNVSDDYRVDSEYSKHRQHSPDGYKFITWQMQNNLKLNRNNTDLNYKENDYEYFKKFTFYSQIVQAMAIKAETEFYRQCQESWYTMGALYWQLNDVWQAPSWSSIDYQRRWKMLQYFAVNFFAPVLVSPRLLVTGDVVVYVINDRFVPLIDVKITVEVFKWSSVIPVNTTTFVGQVDPLSAKKQDIHVNFWENYDLNEVFLRFSLKADGVVSSPFNYIFPRPLKSIKGLKLPNIQMSVTRGPSEPNKYTYRIHIKVNRVVLFLWLETPPILHSYFEENGVIIAQPYFRTNYISTVNVKLSDLKQMITFQYYYEQ